MKQVLSVRISKDSEIKLRQIMSRKNLNKASTIEMAIGILHDDEADIPTSFISDSVKNHFEQESFHLKEEVIKSGNRFFKRGETTDTRLSEQINIRVVMKAYRDKIKGKEYDKEQEKYFGLLTHSFKNQIDAKYA